MQCVDLGGRRIIKKTDATKVAKTGDTMTGTLNMTNVGITATGPNGNITTASSVTASGLFGDGSGLTNLNPNWIHCIVNVLRENLRRTLAIESRACCTK